MTARTEPPTPAGWDVRALRRHLRRSITQRQDRRELNDEQHFDALMASRCYRQDPAAYNRLYFTVRAELNAQP